MRRPVAARSVAPSGSRRAESIGGEDYSAEFAALSPEGAPGFPSATNIEYCPVCQGRRGPCICSRAD